MKKETQLNAIASEYASQGCEVWLHEPARRLGLNSDVLLDLIAIRPDETAEIVEMLDRDRGDEESAARFEEISKLIEPFPKIGFFIRMYDYQDDMVKAWIKLRKEISKLIITKGDPNDPYEKVLDIMEGLKKNFGNY